MNELNKLIDSALRTAETDPSLAVYILRDIEEVKADENLHSLAWVMANGNTTKNEAIWFIKMLEDKIKER